MQKILLLILLIFSVFSFRADAQSGRFRQEIEAFKRQDSIHFPDDGVILFVGSSSFRLWKTLQEDFSGYPVLNRGFGGASLTDVLAYAGEVILPYRPKQVVIYCGDNDLASSDTVTADIVLQRFQQLFSVIRSSLPQTSVAYVSIKPSPSRRHLMPEMEKANKMIQNFLRRHPKTKFVDVYHPMLTAAGEPRKELFVEDNLHMNAQGYAVWKKAIKPVLLK